MRKGKLKIVVMAATAILAVSGEKSFAATSHWNDASQSSDVSAWEDWKVRWKTIEGDYERISIAPGVDETHLNFAWYSHTKEIPKVRYATTIKGLLESKIYDGTQINTTVNFSNVLKESLGGKDGTYYSNKVSISGLKENTNYYYQVFQNGKWCQAKKYKTGDFDSYSILYCADPQIGACKNQVSSENELLKGSTAARNDSYNWNEIITDALNRYNVNFVLSAGDQVNAADSEYEYAGFLYPSIMDSTPLASVIGNHDSNSYSFSWHFNNPNNFDMNNISQNSYTDGHTKAGTDYYYTYGNVLYIVLDSNNYNCKTHENVMAKAVKENPDCTWRVVALHHDIYGPGGHSVSDGMILRTQLTPLMDKFDIDVVFQGHDHTYSRSFQLKSDGKKHTAYDKNNYKNDVNYLKENNCYILCSSKADGNRVVNPEGTVYFEGNSVSGSKFYELNEEPQDYIAERSQVWSPSYSIINVTDTTFTITTYDAATNAVLQNTAPYTIVKNKEQKPKRIDISKQGKVEKIGPKDYTGKAIRPRCKVSAEGKKLKEGKDFKVFYKSNKKIGTAKVIIQGIGNYTGKVSKSFKIVLKAPKLKVTARKNMVAMKWRKIPGADGYIIYSSLKNNGKFTKIKSVKKVTSANYIDKKLKRGKTYYYKIKAYKKVKGKRVKSKYSRPVKVKMK
ncbi:FN3 domain-containing metallophosphoesterase family protein [Anaerosacchariphilus polymeriproducens]|uniref:Calcineurin-like phosphoesterase n=1 Tax=Anaerosacchariphilus polymeriproducens TaxID=1812858 RepID=A0A371AR12_9FIRM|nr:FN3 domain-containing metallophosphoesterase family protein [Anaerosacchariphilus polymeriproducens]RDU21972.1 calcineurin-like phosphoesterase [Anaerosacchariphilus polymeriproducens]